VLAAVGVWARGWAAGHARVATATLVGSHAITPVGMAAPLGVIRGTPLEYTFAN
jgi:hypothetical protein